MRVSLPRPRTVQALIVGAVVLTSAAMVAGSSMAALSGTTVNPGSGVQTGSVALTTDQAGAAIITTGLLAPGATGARCVTVTYAGTLPAAVTLHATASGDLADDLELTVQEGTAAANAGCTGWTSTALIYTGSPAGLASQHPDAATGAGLFAPQGTGATRGYRFVWTLPSTVSNSTQGQSATLNLRWTARAAPAVVPATTGNNASGQLGLGDLVSRSSFAAVGTTTQGGGWSSVARGGSRMCGIRAPGTLWCWGSNVNGGLGYDAAAPVTSPGQVGTASDWRSVAMGQYGSCAIKLDNTLWCWGEGVLGELGDGTNDAFRTTPAQVSGGGSWAHVSLGARYACGIKLDNTLWCWGNGGDNQLGLGSSANRNTPQRVDAGGPADWTSVSAFSFHTCGIRGGDRLWCWGRNGESQLGSGGGSTSIPVVIGTARWATVSAQHRSTCGVQSTGGLFCWGSGSNTTGSYLLGQPDTASRATPTQVGSATTWSSVSRTVALRTDRTLWGWGNNEAGHLGLGTTSTQMGPAQIPVGPTAAIGPGAHAHDTTIRLPWPG